MFECILEYLDTIIISLFLLVSIIAGIVVAIKEKNISALKDVIIKAVEYAENFSAVNGNHITSEAKEEIAKACVLQTCKQRHMKYDDEFVTKQITELIQFSKQVNKREDEE